MKQANLVYIGLGSNLGEKEENIKKAINLIKENYTLISKSSLYISEPWGFKSNNQFINSVICIETSDDVLCLFKLLKNIELNMGRTTSQPRNYEDRIIDLDILFYGNEVINNDTITIPHIEIPNRRFVIEPMFEIAPNFIHPILKKTINILLKECQDKGVLEQINFNLI